MAMFAVVPGRRRGRSSVCALLSDDCDRWLRQALRKPPNYCGKPAAGIVMADLLRERDIGTARRLNETGRQAATHLGIEAQFEKVTDRAEYPKYGLLYTPGLVINNQLVCGGRIPSEAEVMTRLADMLN